MSIPVVVPAGFLGAGETTVLDQLLRSAAEVRLGVVVDDFGSVGVDARLVAGRTARCRRRTAACAARPTTAASTNC